jgi:hypothetical protein
LEVLLKKLDEQQKQFKIDDVKKFVDAHVTAGSSAFTQDQLKDKLSKAFGLTDDTDVQQMAEKKLLGDIIASSFDTARQALDSYFSAEQAQIERSKQLAFDRIDLETKIAKDRAQSQAELEAIDRQAADRKKEADKKALDETKKLKKAEAKIALATELANIAVAAAANPLNPLTAGGAGLAEYSLLAALAFARYFVNVKSIDSANAFARGGALTDILGNGGEFAGKPHAQGGNKFMFQGMPIETEAQEAYVINKNATQAKGVYTVTGTPKQIASSINEIGGGRRFAGGALMYRRMAYGGSLGESLQAPINPASFLLGSSSGLNDIGELKKMVAHLTANINNVSDQTNKRIDKIQVQQVTRSVSDALNKEAKVESTRTF